MKVLLVTASYTPSLNGVAISVESLKKNLIKLGHKVLVLAPDYPSFKKRIKNVIRYPSLANTIEKDYPIPLAPLTIKTLKIIKKFNPDIVHVHHPFHVGFFAKLIADTLKVPLVFTYHTKYDYYSKKYLKLLPAKLKSEFVANTVFDFAKKTDLVIAPSQDIASFIQEKIPGHRVSVIPSIVDDLKFKKTLKTNILKVLKIDEHKTILLCVIRLSPEKNVGMLINAIGNLPEKFVLIICGSGPLEEKVKAEVLKKNLKNRIKFVGKVDREKISDYYNIAHYFVFPSKSETQGLVYLEATKFKLPIVAIENEVAKEWIKKDFGELSSNTSKDLARAIIKLSKRDYKEMSFKAWKFSKNFSSKKCTVQIVNEYKKLRNSNKRHLSPND